MYSETSNVRIKTLHSSGAGKDELQPCGITNDFEIFFVF